jgi:hypothetical protein
MSFKPTEASLPQPIPQRVPEWDEQPRKGVSRLSSRGRISVGSTESPIAKKAQNFIPSDLSNPYTPTSDLLLRNTERPDLYTHEELKLITESTDLNNSTWEIYNRSFSLACNTITSSSSSPDSEDFEEKLNEHGLSPHTTAKISHFLKSPIIPSLQTKSKKKSLPSESSETNILATLSNYIASTDCKFRELSLTNCLLNKDDAKAIFSSLSKNPNFTHLHINNSSFTPAICEQLEAVLYSNEINLNEIYLSNMNIDSKTLVSLIKTMISTGRTLLRLNNCAIIFNKKYAEHDWEEALSSGTGSLKVLQLINIKAHSLTPILKGISQANISTLHIENSHLKREDFEKLKEGLTSGKGNLQTIQLIKSTFDPDSFQVLCEGLIAQNDLSYGVSSLSCESCQLTAAYAQQIQNLIMQSTKLHHLNFQLNKLGSNSSGSGRPLMINQITQSKDSRGQANIEGMKSDFKNRLATSSISTSQIIAVSLSNNTNLQTLNLASNQISDEDYRHFIKALKENKQVTISLADNKFPASLTSSPRLILRKSPRLLAVLTASTMEQQSPRSIKRTASNSPNSPRYVSRYSPSSGSPRHVSATFHSKNHTTSLSGENIPK